MVYKVIDIIAGQKRGVAVGSAVLFLVHPVQTEAVACVSGVSNIVFTLLCLSSFYWYLRSARDQGRGGHALLALALFALALLSKEQSVVLPVLIILYEICFTDRSEIMSSKRWMTIGAFLFVLVGYFVLRAIVAGSMVQLTSENSAVYFKILMSIPRSILDYLNIIFFPRDLHYYRSQDYLQPQLIPIMAFVTLLIGLIWLARRMPKPYKQWTVFGAGWFFISLLPVSNIVPMSNEYSLILTAEHFLYMPVIGVILGVIAVWCHWAARSNQAAKQKAGVILLSVIAAVFVALTMKQNAYWRGEIPLFERTLKYEQGFARVHFLLSQAYANEGRNEDAVVEGQKALTVMQSYLDKVQHPKVREFYLGFVKSIHHLLGQSYDRLGDGDRSLGHFKETLKLDPNNLMIEHTVAFAYVKVRDYRSAVKHLEHIIRLDENNLMARNTLAICYQEIGETAKAEVQLRKIIELDSRSGSAKRNLEAFLKKYNTTP